MICPTIPTSDSLSKVLRDRAWRYFETCPDFIEAVVIPTRVQGFMGTIVEMIPRKWWQLWKPRYAYAYWNPCIQGTKQ